MHVLEAAFTMVDVTLEDQPMVWLNRGFERMTGFSRPHSIGRNCRFLQSEASDPMQVAMPTVVASNPNI